MSGQYDSIKTPPHSLDAEQAVLGGLMLDDAAWDKVADRIAVHDFYRTAHGLIFDAISALADAAEPRDAVTVSQWLERNGHAEKVGGLAEVASLVKNTPSAANIVSHADIVRELSVLRALISAGTEIINSAYLQDGRESRELLDSAERQVFEIAERNNKGKKGFERIGRIVGRAVERLHDLYEQGADVTGLSTGIIQFDEITAGLHPGELIILAGRPGMGKTSLAMNIAEYATMNKKLVAPTAIFNLEMSADQLVMRMIASLSRVPQDRVKTGKLSDEDWHRITSTMQLLSEAPMFIDDTPALSPTEIRARARRLKREHGLGLIVLDYLQLMSIPGYREGRVNEISEISRSMKALAKELEVPIIALSQLNRSVEQRPNKRPLMSDLRESGSLEQDADLVLFVYRDDYYNPDSADKGTAEIIIGKHRNGPTGMVRTTFIGEFTRFENYMPDTY